MKRRKFLTRAAVGTAGLALSPLSFARAAKRNGERRPNILFISVDDINDWIGCMGGHPNAITPNIDRLASRGTLFSNAHCAAPICNASRGALMTGIAPHKSGVYNNGQPFRLALPKAVTLPQFFMNHGYQTLGAGKVFHGPRTDVRSWHETFPGADRNRPQDPRPPKFPMSQIRMGRSFDPNYRNFDWGPLDVADDEMGDAKVANRVVEELKKKHDAPFFIGVGIYRPHLPWYVPRKYFDMHPLEGLVLPKVDENDLDDVPEAGRRFTLNQVYHRKVLEYDVWKDAVRGYLASTTFADAMVGRVLDALDASPYAENTIVMIWGDHGWHLGEKLHWRKFALWEEATHCPLIVRAPGVGKPGVCGRPASLIDMYPTLADLAGLPAPEVLDGESLVPFLKDPEHPRTVPVLMTNLFRNHSLRDERWRYIRYEDGSEELYDHSVDPLEWKNLAGDPKYAELKQRMLARLPKTNAPSAPERKWKDVEDWGGTSPETQ